MSRIAYHGFKKETSQLRRSLNAHFGKLHSFTEKIARKEVSDEPGVYMIYRDGKMTRRPIYIGSSSNLHRRLFDNFEKARSHSFATHICQKWKIVSKEEYLAKIRSKWRYRFLHTERGKEFYVETLAIAAFYPDYDRVLWAVKGIKGSDVSRTAKKLLASRL